MKNIIWFIAIIFLTSPLLAQPQKVDLLNDDRGMKLLVDGEDFMINGMNWDYFPIGTNFSYSLWSQPDHIIQEALDQEMSLLKNMGVNSIRLYTGVQPRWITYIFENYGIYTMLNHSFGRYGLTINGAWIQNTDYGEENTKTHLIKEVETLAKTYKNTPGLLMYLLGNENNYGLFWEGAETEDIPIDERRSTIHAKDMYQLFNEAALQMKKIDKMHPIAICNGDLQFIDIIANSCQDIDILGVNMYRGISFGDAFDTVKKKLNKPILFAEFGADAFNAVAKEEDQKSQSFYVVGNWKEIYENAYGLGKTGNAIGGFTFQFSDGWWKFGQTTNLDLHDDNASWENGGYLSDYVKGENNMNEEWFGICAKGPSDQRGLYKLYPRAAYYALQKVHMLNPYNDQMDISGIDAHFSQINLMNEELTARGDRATLLVEEMKKVRIRNARAEITTFYTNGKRITTPEQADTEEVIYPDQLGFDHMESFYFEVEAKPASNVQATVAVNVLGTVATNPIDEIFYENRGRPVELYTDGEELQLLSINRVQIYNAEIKWSGRLFDLTSFYRKGHYHWGYEGDIFGLYPEANYGPNIDIYNGAAPSGLEIDGKKYLEGLTVAFGPELWWGANPAVLVKYNRNIQGYKLAAIYHEDIADQESAVSSIAIPTPMTRRVTLALEKDFGDVGIQLGGIWAGEPRVGETFQYVEGDVGNYTIYQDIIQNSDTWGGKIKFTLTKGPFNWYGQAAAMGLVAGGGADNTQTFTGWRLKDSGSGNQMNVLTGVTYLIGDFQLAPNFLWQKPIVGPMPSPQDLPEPGRSRNILDDPFAVRQNRETVAGELLITYDPTPGTWMYTWDNDMVEDAPFAASLGFIYRHLPTTQDAAIGIQSDGRSTFAFEGAPPAHDLWEINARMVSKLRTDVGIIANIYGGTAQANGSDERLVERFGIDLRAIYKKIKLSGKYKINDWGPYDYHRDFNQTFPMQVTADLSTSLSTAKWLDIPNTSFGVRYTWRSLNEYSPRYSPTLGVDASGEFIADPTAVGYPNGNEWELRTYLHVQINR